jgi:hypothetical protein
VGVAKFDVIAESSKGGFRVMAHNECILGLVLAAEAGKEQDKKKKFLHKV